MTPSRESARLRRWADEIDAEERAERETELEKKVDRLEAQLASSGLSADDRALLTRARERLAALEAADSDGGTNDDQGSRADGARNDDDDGGSGSGDDQGRRRRRTRPGRKSGAAYDWTLDDDGEVVRSDVAVVYSGEDEPDEVELEAAE